MRRCVLGVCMYVMRPNEMRAMSEAAPRPPPFFPDPIKHGPGLYVVPQQAGRCVPIKSPISSLSLPPTSQVVRARSSWAAGWPIQQPASCSVASFEPQPGRKAPAWLSLNVPHTYMHACMHARSRAGGIEWSGRSMHARAYVRVGPGRAAGSSCHRPQLASQLCALSH